jgi:hypothetical protein
MVMFGSTARQASAYSVIRLLSVSDPIESGCRRRPTRARSWAGSGRRPLRPGRRSRPAPRRRRQEMFPVVPLLGCAKGQGGTSAPHALSTIGCDGFFPSDDVSNARVWLPDRPGRGSALIILASCRWVGATGYTYGVDPHGKSVGQKRRDAASAAECGGCHIGELSIRSSRPRANRAPLAPRRRGARVTDSQESPCRAARNSPRNAASVSASTGDR